MIALKLKVNEKTKTVSVLSSGNTLLGSALPVNSTYLEALIIIFYLHNLHIKNKYAFLWFQYSFCVNCANLASVDLFLSQFY